MVPCVLVSWSVGDTSLNEHVMIGVSSESTVWGSGLCDSSRTVTIACVTVVHMTMVGVTAVCVTWVRVTVFSLRRWREDCPAEVRSSVIVRGNVTLSHEIVSNPHPLT